MTKKYKLLLLTTLIISGCSMCYELIISAVSSYLLGNSMLQYSITIGLFMFALGIGSYLSRFLSKKLFTSLIRIELSIGIIGGTSALVLFFANLYIISYDIVMYLEIIIIGTLAGAEIPLLTRIIEEDEQNLKFTISSIFSFDYIGSLIGAIVFPILLMPKLGYFGTSFLCGLLNIIAAALIVWKYSKKLDNASFYKFVTIIIGLLMVFGIIFAENLSHKIEHGLYMDRVILDKQTVYQKIVMTKHKDDTRLFINGNCQFSSKDEYRYHEALVHIPMMQVDSKKNIDVLVLGGGDGMAVRELLKYNNIKSIELVDLDKEMVKICSENKNITELNNNSLKSKKLTIYDADAYEFIDITLNNYDLIIVDLPDPNSEALTKLYSNVFYEMCKKKLRKGGVLVTQSTSPYYATKAFWCINKTIKNAGFNVKAYHLEVPAFGDWGFNMAKMGDFKLNNNLEVDTRYLSNDNINSLFYFGKDELANDVEVNHLTYPILMEYYNRAIEEWR